MVASYLYRYAAWALLLFVPGLWAAQLTLQFPATELERGRSVRAVLATDQLRQSLKAVDLAPLSPWFVVERRGELTVDKRRATQAQVIWLTPRKTGEFHLPSLHLGGLRCGTQLVRITPARDAGDGEVISPRFPSLPSHAWARQQLVYTVAVESTRRFLRLEAEPVELEGFEVMAIPQQVEAITGGRRYRHTAGWLLFPVGAGGHRLQLPALRYGREGVMSHRFYPPPLSIDIEPLPEYLPPGLAVGEIDVQGAERPWRLTRSGELQQRSVTVTTRGIPSKWWRPPAIQVADPDAVHLYESQPQRSEVIDASGLAVSYRYRLPLSIDGSGWYSLEPWQLRYFDPQTGRLQGGGRVIELPLALHLWQEILLWLALLLSAIYAARSVLVYVQRRYRYLKGYRCALRQLHGSRDLAAMRDVLQQLAVAEGWESNLSLEAWTDHWRRCNPHIDIAAWVQGFEAAIYGRESGDVEALRLRLIQLLRLRLGVWRRVVELQLY
jgi:hypothetical protein